MQGGILYYNYNKPKAPIPIIKAPTETRKHTKSEGSARWLFAVLVAAVAASALPSKSRSCQGGYFRGP